MRTFLCKRGNTPPTSPTLPTCIRPLVTTNHSTVVANKHYWQVTPEDFERAIRDSSKAAHNPAQHLHVSARTDSQTPPTADKKIPLLPVPALPCETVPTAGMPPQGLEPVPSSPQKTPLLEQGNAQYNALFGDDERVRVLLEAWPDLPDTVKAAVMEMVGGW